MFELLTHEEVALYIRDDDWTVNEAFVDIPNARNPKYSNALTELIKLCLMPDPWDRPTVEELELKIETRCHTIRDVYAANPDLRQKDRLYYKGSEINRMPRGPGNYWKPVGGHVPEPSEPPDPHEIHNPFTAPIDYPRFPNSQIDDLEEGRRPRTGDDANQPIILSGSSGSGRREHRNGSEDSSSDNSDTRRRMAAKKLPSA